MTPSVWFEKLMPVVHDEFFRKPGDLIINHNRTGLVVCVNVEDGKLVVTTMWCSSDRFPDRVDIPIPLPKVEIY